MYRVDLNSDLGEGFGAYAIGLNKEVITQVSSANVACSYHTGDPLAMAEIARLCREAEVAIDAHPGLPDLMGFGRRGMACPPKEVKTYMSHQLGVLYTFAKTVGLKLQHVKPHSALYNMAAKGAIFTHAVAEAAAELGDELILLDLTNSFLLTKVEAVGLRTASEVSADRVYQTNGSLVPCFKEGTMIHDKQLVITHTVCVVKEGKVITITSKEVPLRADSICIHGDDPSAIEFIRGIRKTLTEEGAQVEAFGNFIQ